MAKKKVNVDALVTGLVGLNDVGQTIRSLQQPSSQIKVLVAP
jgi:threonine dehydrogenase-like Zn-dependent dehydrogenase